MTTCSTWIGLDVSKDSIEVCLLRENGKTHFKQFPNTSNGHLKLLRWTQHLVEDGSSHFCMEATGSYSNEVALFLAEAEQKVSVLNPARPPKGHPTSLLARKPKVIKLIKPTRV